MGKARHASRVNLLLCLPGRSQVPWISGLETLWKPIDSYGNRVPYLDFDATVEGLARLTFTTPDSCLVLNVGR